MIRNAKNKDRALARTGNTDVLLPTTGEEELEDGEAEEQEIDATKIIVIHPGSQNLRIGFASDALPKSIPMAAAQQWLHTESNLKLYEAEPKRVKKNVTPEEQFGEEFSKKYTKMCADLKVDMRANKRKVLPNSKELVVNYNKRTAHEEISEHNDPLRIEWTDVKGQDKYDIFAGHGALRVPDNSKPAYKVVWPMRHGWLNEKGYVNIEVCLDDFEMILEKALKNELGLTKRSDWEKHKCVFIIPDLYDKKYVEFLLRIAFSEMEFQSVAFIQEGLAASYGAGYASACIVDVGAQKTSIACVEEGMLVEDSRINLKYGGWDVTETFMKMMLHDHFPYQEINLNRRYDFLLAEELKINFCTMNQAEISVQLYNFHLRAPQHATRKYQFKTYDETILAPMGFYDPSIFNNKDKLSARRTILERSYNAYDPEMPDDPVSAAQLAILAYVKPSLAATPSNPANGNIDNFATPQCEKSNPLNRMDSDANGNSRINSTTGSPTADGTPNPPMFQFGNKDTNGEAPSGSGLQPTNGTSGSHAGTPAPAGLFIDALNRSSKDIANERDAVLPIAPLDFAVLTSVQHAARGDDKKVRDFLGGIMVIGGGAKIPGFGNFLEEKLKAKRPDLKDKVLVGTSPKEMDGQVVVWKGGSVFARMKSHESWVEQVEWDRLGARALHNRMMWQW